MAGSSVSHTRVPFSDAIANLTEIRSLGLRSKKSTFVRET